MAVVAGVVTRNVSGRLAAGLGAVVAGEARAGDLRVITRVTGFQVVVAWQAAQAVLEAM